MKPSRKLNYSIWIPIFFFLEDRRWSSSISSSKENLGLYFVLFVLLCQPSSQIKTSFFLLSSAKLAHGDINSVSSDSWCFSHWWWSSTQAYFITWILIQSFAKNGFSLLQWTNVSNDDDPKGDGWYSKRLQHICSGLYQHN